MDSEGEEYVQVNSNKIANTSPLSPGLYLVNRIFQERNAKYAMVFIGLLRV
jgi:hypothetical protein